MALMIPEIDMHKHFKDKDKTQKIIDLFLRDMVEQGYSTVRIIHGKGKGNYRKLIYSYLEKHELVEGFTLCDVTHGGSGATFVHLKGKII
ncbi:Smr/MutS family protein [bacterium]|nr:Smr/MutS family protein [bacterium]